MSGEICHCHRSVLQFIHQAASAGFEIRKICRLHFITGHNILVTKCKKLATCFNLLPGKKNLVFHLQSALILIWGLCNIKFEVTKGK